MPLYELVCIAQHYPQQYTPLRTLLSQTAAFINSQGGSVRRLDTFGTKSLPKRIRKDDAWHEKADYWTMHFDTNPSTLKALQMRMKDDPRVLRWTTLKKATTLEQVTSSLATHDQTLEYPKNESVTSILDMLKTKPTTKGNNRNYAGGGTVETRADRAQQRSGSQASPKF